MEVFMNPDFDIVYQRVVGLDVHSKIIIACHLSSSDEGESIFEYGTYPTTRQGLSDLADFIEKNGADLVVMESTGIYWQRPYDALVERGINAIVANARHVKNRTGDKTDTKDARWLAILARAGLITASFVPDPKFRDLRDISRYYAKLTQVMASEKNRLNKLMMKNGLLLSNVMSDIHGVSGKRILECILSGGTKEEAAKLAAANLRASEEELLEALDDGLNDESTFVLNKVYNSINKISEELQEIKIFLLDKLEPYSWALNMLQTIPGIDSMGAAMLLVEIGDDMKRFGSAASISAWSGLRPGNNESAGKRLSGRITNGNKYLRRLLCQFAHAAVKGKNHFRFKYQSLLIRRGKKRAIVAIAHKILRTIYGILSSRKPYEDQSVDYEEMMVAKNAPRWAKKLVDFGYVAPDAIKKPERKPKAKATVSELKKKEPEEAKKQETPELQTPSIPKKRGRPPKNKENVDTTTPAIPKKRGRPPKVLSLEKTG
jgi:transposase